MKKGRFRTYYLIEALGFQIDGTYIAPQATPQEMIVDSGTTLMLLEARLWDAFVSHMQAHYCHLPGKVGSYSLSCGKKANDSTIYTILGVCGGRSMFTFGECVHNLPFTQFPTITLDLENNIQLKLAPELYFLPYTTVMVRVRSDADVLG